METQYVGVPAEPEFTLRLRAASAPDWWPNVGGDRVEINGDGTYSASVDASGMTRLIWLTLTNDDGAIPARYSNARITINSVTINGTEIGLTNNTNIPMVSTHYSSGELEVDISVWTGEWTQRLTTGIAVHNDVFGMPGDAPLSMITFNFSVSGVAPCEKCNQVTCTCENNSGNLPARRITRSGAQSNCTVCDSLMDIRITTVTAGGTVVTRRESAKRNMNRELFNCAHSFSRAA
jgi:hypothetical protein